MKQQIGVYICHCGTNIAATVDCPGLAQFFGSLPGVTVARDYRYLCSDPGRSHQEGYSRTGYRSGGDCCLLAPNA